MKILIADDSIPIRKQLVDELLKMPEVEVVWDGPYDPVIVDVTHQTHPDVVLLNVWVNQPSQSGMAFETLMDIHQLNPRPFIIMLGDRRNEHYEALYKSEALKRGADLYVDRTQDMKEILELIRSLVEKCKHD